MDEDSVSDDVVGEGKVDISKLRNSSAEQEGKNKTMQKSCSSTSTGKPQAKLC